MTNGEQTIRCVVEANHIHRAGQKYGKKIFLVDVIGVISKEIIDKPITDVTVIYGTIQGADKEQVFIDAMAKHSYTTRVIGHTRNVDGTYNFATEPALVELLDSFPDGAKLVLVGFSGRKYSDVINKHRERLTILLAAFSTVNNIGTKQYIVSETKDKVRAIVYLDNYAQSVFAFHKAKRSRPEGVEF